MRIGLEVDPHDDHHEGCNHHGGRCRRPDNDRQVVDGGPDDDGEVVDFRHDHDGEILDGPDDDGEVLDIDDDDEAVIKRTAAGHTS